jgi:hypothetical protein
MVAQDLPQLLARNERNAAAAALPDRLATVEHELARLRREFDAAAREDPYEHPRNDQDLGSIARDRRGAPGAAGPS